MRVGILGALREEVDLLVRKMRHPVRVRQALAAFHSGTLSGVPAVVARCGVGKVNAAVCAQLLISRFRASHLIVTGVAGAVDPRLEVGDIVVSSDCVQHDVDATALGCKPGQILFSDMRLFRADRGLRQAVLAAARQQGLKPVTGRILTGDRFLSSPSGIRRLQKLFNGVCVEMEGAAVAQVCALNRVPFVIIRSISDRADGSAGMDFAKFLPGAARTSSTLVEETVRRLARHGP